MIDFIVPAVPVAQPRQRHRIVQPKGGKAFATNYTPAKDPVNAFKASVRVAAAHAYQGPPLTGPIQVDIIFVLPRTKPAWLKRDSSWWECWKSGLRVPHAVSRNDRDNLMKSVQDCLNGLLWVDDGQIYSGQTEKWLASEGEQPHVEVRITR
jgi:Holliday junction resolvase RusA-like endonuclease